MNKSISQIFDEVHHQGAMRHGGMWLITNQNAVARVIESGIDISAPKVKTAVSIAILAALDACFPVKTEGADAQEGE